MRRLYVQIYMTIIASLVLVVVVSGAVWHFAGNARFNNDAFEVAGKLVAASLAPGDAPLLEQQRAVRKLAQSLEVDIALFDDNRALVASWGKPLAPPSRGRHKSGLNHGPDGPGWHILLPDKRWLVTGKRSNRSWRVLAPIAFFGSVAIVIGLCAYPVVRRLTGRLERLQSGVERIGAGDFSIRVAIEGKDEVAQLGKSFNRAAEKIETLLSSHRKLLANASHELRTPLSRIRLGIDLYKGKGDGERKKALEQDIDELDQLVDEILLMSRLDAHSRNEPWEQVDLLALCAEECVHYEDCAPSGASVIVNGDVRLLQRMIRNLLENASRHAKPPIEVRLNTANGLAIIEVLDHGPGIPLPEREKVFAPFYRGPDRQNIKGSGLGLALVSQIAQSHKGGVEFFDDAQSGLFGVRVMLPLA